MATKTAPNNWNIKTFTATVANGATTSDAVDMYGYILCGIEFPTTMTSTTCTFQAATSLAGTYKTVRDVYGTTYTPAIAGNIIVPVDCRLFLPMRYIKIVTGSAEGAARSITLIGREV